MSTVVAKVVRTQVGETGLEIIVDLDKENFVTAEHYAPPGIDAHPIPGDDVQLTQLSGDRWNATAYDMAEKPTTQPGEIRFIARDVDTGTVTASFLMSRDGTVTINGLTIDKDGNLYTRGKVTSAAGGADINLHDHVHPHSMGPTTGPVPPPSV